MKRRGSLGKALFYLLLVVVVLGVGALAYARHYLASGKATRQVTERLQALLGEKVEVGEADIGLRGGSTLRGLKVYDAADRDASRAWLSVKEIDTDLSALSVVRGESMPDRLDLHGAEVYLRFNKDGHLLTQLPKSKETTGKYPAIRLDGGKLTLDQEGRQPMVIQGVSAELTPDTDTLKLKGSVTDPYWGNWSLDGTCDLKAGDYALTLNAPDVEVTPEKLKNIALVPPKVWKQVLARGHTPARITFDYNTGRHGAHYQIDLDPQGAWLEIPSIDLQATGVRGKIVVDDELVLLNGLTGKIADGDIATSGKLDFRGETTRLQFDVKVNGAVLHKLPRSWGIQQKANIDGKLTGSANLVVLLPPGSDVRTQGRGHGVINEARWGKINFQPIHLELYATGKGFGFRQKSQVSRGVLPSLAALALVGLARPARPAPVAADWRLQPERLLEAVPRVVCTVTDKLVDSASAALDQLNRWSRPLAPGQQPNLLEADLGLEDVDLTLLVQQAGLKLPFDLTGRLSFQMHVGIPIDTPRDLKAYRFRGNATFRRLAVAGFAMAEVKARVHYANGVLELQELNGNVPQPPRPGAPATAGTFAGNARWEVVPEGNLTADLKVRDVPLDRALDAVPGAAGSAEGILSGSVRASVAAARLKDPAAWRVTGALAAPQVRLYGLTLKGLAADVNLAEGRARLSGLKADLQGAPVTGSAQARLAGDWPFSGKLDLGKMDLASLNRLAPSVRAPVSVAGTVSLAATFDGTLKPVNVKAKGTASAKGLVVEGVKVDDLSFEWTEGNAGLALNAIRAKLYQGQVTGSAVLPVRPTQPGRVDLKIQEVDVQQLARSLPSVPVRIEGKVSGSVVGKITAAAADKPRAVSTDIELSAPLLRVQGIPAQHLSGKVDYRAGEADYSLTGETLGGKFRLKGKLPPRPAAPAPAPGGGGGELEVEGVHLGRLFAALRLERTVPLDGTLTLRLKYSHRGADRLPVGDGTFEIADVSWGDTDLTDSVAGKVALTGEELRLSDITSEFGQGLLRAGLRIPLTRRGQGRFFIALDHAEASQVLLPFPELARNVRGALDLRLSGTLGPEWSGGGTAVLTQGRVYGVPVSEWRVPLDFRYAPSSGNGELDVRGTSATLAQGHATGDASYSWGGSGRLNGSLRFSRVNLSGLGSEASSFSSYASGRLTGRVDFGGSDVRSVNDINATVTARMGQTQAAQVPVLSQLTRFFGGGQTSTFQRGELRGTLSRGVFRLQRFSLTGNYTQVFMHGNITLSGLLDLQVLARTGVGVNGPLALLLGPRLLTAAALPASLLVEATALLSGQVVRLHVGGTVRHPVIQVLPLATLTEEAVRFFLGGTGVGAGTTGP